MSQNETAACSDTVPCAVFEVDIRCPGIDFAGYGITTATSPNAIWLSTADSDSSRLFHLAPSVSHQVDAPFDADNDLILLAERPDGSIALAVDSTDPASEDFAKGLTYATLDDEDHASPNELVFDGASVYVPPLGLAVAPDGTAHTWHRIDQGNSVVHSSRNAAGQWTHDSFGIPAQSTHLFSLSPEGIPVAFWIQSAGISSTLNAQMGDSSTQLSVAISDEGYTSYLPAPAPQPYAVFDSEIAPYGILLIENNDLRLAWSMTSGPKDVTLPDTATRIPQCASIENTGNYPTGECPADCTEQSTGIESIFPAVAITRVENGDFIVAYIVSKIDQIMKYEKQCYDSPDMCQCVSSVKQDNSTYSLHLVRVSSAGVLTSALETPVDAPTLFYQSSGGPMSMSAYGSTVSIAMRHDDPNAQNKILVRVTQYQL